MNSIRAAIGVVGFALALSNLRAADLKWNRDVRPVLSENCFACHGPDAAARKAGLRLDTKEGLFEKTPKREPAVVAGKPDESELWRRIMATDPDDLMPPPDSHKVLKSEQKELLKSWILAGAPWEGHWAFIKPERAPVPTVAREGFPIRNPIDSFILAKLQAQGLQPAGEADRRTLARRLSLDLTGLPPRPEDVERFVRDSSPHAYEMLVKKYMALPQWGEHRARYWLDAARYADTHGLHFDNYREMWPYRDWVIKAFNNNIPFDQFSVKQIAGDLLEDPCRDDLIATGFHRCNPTTNEGGTIDEENEANYANDRVTTTSWVWLGLTANCASCHDHKFDPITTKDFYSMAAFFRNTVQGPKDGNIKDTQPSILVPQTSEDEKRWDALPREITSAKKSIDQRRDEAKPDFNEWFATATAGEFDKEIPRSNLVVHLPLNVQDTQHVTATVGSVNSIKLGENPEWQDGELGPALVLKKGATIDLGNQGDFAKDEEFSFGAWVRVSKTDGETGAVLARMDTDNVFRGWDLLQVGKKFAVHLVHKWPDDGLKVSTRNDVIKDKTWQHVFVTYDASAKAKGLKIYIDGAEVPLKEDKDSLTGSIRTKVPLRVGQRSAAQFLERGRVQDVRVYERKLAGAEVRSLSRAVRMQHLLAIDDSKRTKEQRESAFQYWLDTRDPLYLERTKLHAKFKAEQDAIRERNPVAHIQREKTNSMPVAHILFRGQYDKPKDKVEAETIASLHPMPKHAPRNRLGLAKWIVDPQNPLTARVTLNRFWSEIFGTGLVRTADDFGMAGDQPANQALLDWLAVEFQESGWDVKHMFYMMVTSSAYRQSAETTPEKLEKDPQNRLISRGPRFRMDAEMVRDCALAASGLLAPRIGGASVKPYQPDGVWEAVAMPESNTKKYTRDKADGLYRRSLYTFWKRAAPPALMDIFNAPSREVCTVKRERTNTPLQALATLNDPQFIEAGRKLAEHALADVRRPEEAIDKMAARLLSRPLTPKELIIVTRTLAETQAYYEKQPEAAKEFLSIGESQPSETLPASQLAAMTMVANQLMNMDEVLNK